MVFNPEFQATVGTSLFPECLHTSVCFSLVNLSFITGSQSRTQKGRGGIFFLPCMSRLAAFLALTAGHCSHHSAVSTTPLHSLPTRSGPPAWSQRWLSEPAPLASTRATAHYQGAGYAHLCSFLLGFLSLLPSTLSTFAPQFHNSPCSSYNWHFFFLSAAVIWQLI